MTVESDPQFVQAAAHLLRFAQHDDKDALEQCLRICVQPAYRQAYAELGNQADAHDASQEALLQLTRHADRYQAQRPLAPWLAQHVAFACAHLRRSALRRRRREEIAGREQERSMQQDQREQELYNVAVDQEALEHLRSAVAQLKDKDRALISMHYFAEQSQAQVADALGISENAASVRIHRVRGKLKRILEKQGMRAELTLLPALLAAAPLPPVQLLAQTLHCCSAAVLPSTTIPLTIIEKTTMLIQAHPIISLAATILLSVAGISSPLLWAADQAPVQNSPVVAAVASGTQWNPAAQKLLAFHDPDALIQFACDGPALRQLLLDSKPFSYLKTAAGKQLLASWDQEFQRYIQWGDPGMATINEMIVAWRTQRGFLLQTDNPPYSSMFALDIGEDNAALLKTLAHGAQPSKQSQGYQFYGDSFAVNGTTIVSGLMPVEIPNEPTTNAALQQYPAWFRLYPKHLLATYAEHKQLFDKFYDYLGADWDKRDVNVQLHVERDQDTLVLKGILKDLSFNGLYLGAILVSEEAISADRGTFGTSSLPIAPVQLHPAQHLPALSEKALINLHFACDYMQHSALQQRLATILQQQLQAPALAAAWNGELLLGAEPGLPFPKPQIVIGLHGDLTALQQQLSSVLEGMDAQEVPVASLLEAASNQVLLKAWSLFTPLGSLSVAIAKDRLVISGDTNVTSLMQSQLAAHALSLRVDLPNLAKTYGPMLWSMIPLQKKSYLMGYYLVNSHLDSMLTRLVNFSGRTAVDTDTPIDSETMNKSILSSDEYKTWIMEQGKNQTRVSKYLSVWMDAEPHQKLAGWKCKTRVVFRTQAGWHFFDDYGDASPHDLLTVQEQLKGFSLVAGSKLAALKFHPRGSIPVIDREKQLPTLEDAMQFMPVYELTWDRDAQGTQHYTETGLPLTAAMYAALSISLMEMEPLREIETEQAIQQNVLVFEQHAARFKALKKISTAMAEHNLIHRSDILDYVPVDVLWALGLGQHPTAAQINKLGLWDASKYGESCSIKVYASDQYLIQRTGQGVRLGQTIGTQLKWAFKLDAKHWIVLGPGVLGISAVDTLPASMKAAD